MCVEIKKQSYYYYFVKKKNNTTIVLRRKIYGEKIVFGLKKTIILQLY
jgi:hypothetical protein